MRHRRRWRRLSRPRRSGPRRARKVAAAGGGATGDDLISSYATNQSGGGGGGGASPGGGGGGTLEITAGGTLKIGAVSANGGAGGAGSLLAGAAGGGSGGTVILRSGGPITLGSVTVGGGSGGYDAPSVMGAAGLPSTAQRGAAFAADNPIATSDPQPAITLISAASGDAFKLFVIDATGVTTVSSTVVFGTGMAVVKPPLSPGYNRICVATPLGSLAASESMNCIEIGYAR
ncbi:MAG: hypothetical protein E6J90_48965 [Deltaproteobacteria bacterium]|nr:MAG: hypothetical protein E6J90_48965 [Deltaproteobacteria bacterium]